MINNNELTPKESEALSRIRVLAESKESREAFPGKTTTEIMEIYLDYMETLCDE